MELRLLGSVELVGSDGQASSVGSPKQRTLLSVLALRAGEVVSVQRLIDELWPEEPPRSAEATLQSHLSGLRGKLADASLRATREGGYVLEVEPSQVDVHRFEELVRAGEAALTDGECDVAAGHLRRALELCRGDVLADVPDGPTVQAARARLAERGLEAVEARISADLACGRHAELVGELDELVTAHPFRERLWRDLMLARYRCGHQADALAAYESARRALADELGIDPSPSLQQLHEQILRQDPAIDAPGDEPPGGAPAPAVTSPAPSAPPTSPPAAVGAPGTAAVRGYQLLDQLGSGSLGVVYRGHQPAVERDVAIKVVHSRLANDPDFVRRFEVEAQRVAQLEHPHIVPLYDYWREPDAAYLVMRWLRGGSVAHALRAGAWSLAAVARLVEQLAAALDYVHRQHVAHLDVKPANVLLDGEGYAYLSDFGIASLTRDALGDGAQGSEGGRRLPYVSPEQVTAEPLTPATDVFALGLLAFELLTGRHPYHGESPASLRQRVVHQPLPGVHPPGGDLGEGVGQTLQRATAADPARRFGSAGDLADALRREAGDSAVVATGPATRNPYKGLRAFGEADAGDFFGRERLVEQLLARIDATGPPARLVTVVGPSGSGKSSLVRAGLLPALRAGRARGSQHWFATTMRPGTRPLDELERAVVEVAACDPGDVAEALAADDGLSAAAEAALPDPAGELVLAVDQFEELFTLADDQQRAAFTRALQRVATSETARVRVVATVRADFYDHPLLDPELGELAAATTVAVPALSRDELERAVVEPARAVGVRLDADLTAQIVNDVADAPAALPLLQYALTELFARRTGDVLTLDSYRAIGGVRGALAGRADQLHTSLDPAGRRACHQLFLRLVTVDRARADVRRRVARAELAELAGDDAIDRATIDHVIETFGSHRLLTFDRDPTTRAPTVEVAHEALLASWDRLRGWVEHARDDLLRQQRLAAAAEEWLAADRDEAYLLHGARLAEFEQWAPGSDVALTHGEQQLLAASRQAEDARQRREQARRERERELERRSRTRRRLAVLSVVAVILAAGVSVFAVYQYDLARDRQRMATVQQLTQAASSQLTEDAQRGVLLGIEAVLAAGGSDGPAVADAQTALREALHASAVVRRLPAGGGMSAAADGRVATLGSDGTLTVWGPDGSVRRELAGQSTAPWKVDAGEATATRADDVDFSADGSRLVVADHDQRGVILDADTGEVVTALGGSRLTDPLLGPHGERVAAIVPRERTGFAGARDVGVWSTTTGELIRRFEPSRPHELAFSPDGSRLAALGGDALQATVQMWELDSGERLWREPTNADAPAAPRSMAFRADGEQLLVGTESGRVVHKDAADGTDQTSFPAHTEAVTSMAVSDDGQKLVTVGTDDGDVWDLAARAEPMELRGSAPIAQVAFTAGGDRVVSTSPQGITRVWDISSPRGYEHPALPTDAVLGDATKAVFTRGGHLASVGADSAVHLRHPDAMDQQRRLRATSASRSGHYLDTLARSGDGTTIAAVVADDEREGRAAVWDVASGSRTDFRHGIAIRDVALDHDGSHLAMIADVGDGRVLRVVDVATGAERSSRELASSSPARIAWIPQQPRLVVATRDGAHVTDATTGERLHALRAAGDDGASRGRATRGQPDRDERDRISSVRDVAVVDAQRVVVSQADGSVAVFDLATGERIRAIPELAGAPSRLDVRDGTLALARGDTVVVRDLSSGQKRFAVEYDRPVAAVRLAPGAGRLATTLESRVVHLHAVDPEELVELAEQATTRELTPQECRRFLDRPCPRR